MLHCRDRSTREPPDPVALAVVSDAAKETDGGRVLCCAGCQQRVTTAAARIEVGGSHEHTCENPHGYRYLIGCFAVAHGLRPFGSPSTHWSWFPGRSWQVQHCASCDRHLGWRFASTDSSFYGLILDALVEIDLAT